MTKTFRDLGVDGALCDALAAEGITHPFPIQELTLPLALGGNDLIGQARTGTGKTLAFGLPLLQRLDPAREVTQALVVVPTRELCLQVYDDLKIGAAKGLTSIAVYGGVGFDEQIEALRGGVHVVVGTPGRLLDHLNRRNLDLSQVTQLVLDEADEMLDMGFLPDVERLIEACTGPDRHTMLFSATMPTAIVKLARRYMQHPTFTRADTEQHETAPNVAQYFFQVHRMDKPRVLARILQTPDRGGVYVFVRTKHMADRLVNELEELGVGAVPIHGDLRQTSREKNLDRFRSGKATVLVATEVAARGLDVGGVTHVVNYDCPDDEKMYLHRIGRTARAGEAGVAITFAEFNEVDKLNVIRKRVGATDTPVEQVFSTSDALTERFALPEERPWDRLASSASDRGGSDRGRSGRDGSSRGGSDRGGSRRGRSDGRPKSDRRTEGAGGEHDATRGRRGSSGRGRDERRGDDRARARGGRRDDADQPERDERPTDGDRTARPTGGGRDADTGDARSGTERTRTRTRTRSRPSPSDGGTEAAPGDGTRTRAEREDADGSGAASGDQPRARKRARTGRSDRSGSAGSSRSDESARARSRSSGQRSGETRQGADSDSGRSDSGRSGSGRSGSGSGRSGSGNERNGSSRSGRGDGDGRTRGSRDQRSQGGRQSRSGGERSGRRGDDSRGASVPVQKRGREARGDGQPQPSRRVKVEHLP